MRYYRFVTAVEKLLASMQESTHNIKYKDLYRVCVHFFGTPRNVSSSHVIFSVPWQGDPRINIQPGKAGAAKPYQIRQVLAAVEKLRSMGHKEA